MCRIDLTFVPMTLYENIVDSIIGCRLEVGSRDGGGVLFLFRFSAVVDCGGMLIVLFLLLLLLLLLLVVVVVVMAMVMLVEEMVVVVLVAEAIVVVIVVSSMWSAMVQHFSVWRAWR